MTALRPTENARVVGLKDGQMKLLRKLVLNQVCGHPDCGDPTCDPHHIWPRSLITNDSWFVEITDDDGKTVLPNIIGLCRPHHDDVEQHRSWIRLEDGVFNWYDRVDANDVPGAVNPQPDVYEAPEGWQVGSGSWWQLVGPLVPQPGQVGQVKKPRKKAGATDARKSRFVRYRVPDDAENGAEILKELIQVGRDEWADDLGWTETVPPYYVICAAFVKALQ